jgi:hypothetical protein
MVDKLMTIYGSERGQAVIANSRMIMVGNAWAMPSIPCATV